MSHSAAHHRHRGMPLVATLVLAAGLAGCTTADAFSTPTPEPTPEPFFATDQEAYDAALALYAEYIQVTNDINRAGGTGNERLLDLADTDYANELFLGDAKMREAGVTANGDLTFRGVALVWINARRSEFDVEICRGMAGIRMTDQNGNDVTPRDQPAEEPVVVSFKADSTKRVRLTGSERWSGDSFC